MRIAALGVTLSVLPQNLPLYIVFDDGQLMTPGDPNTDQTVGRIAKALQNANALSEARIKYYDKGVHMRGSVCGVSVLIHPDLAEAVAVLHMTNPQPIEQLKLDACDVSWVGPHPLHLLRMVHRCEGGHRPGGQHMCRCGARREA